ncbi:MBL fold metallo-hydrolase [Hymenobacter gummosus]|uniref:MBL fold metallo-hydrolase n=1 Tax=Hymenobacter gummosus TaxID=1776032 RepID=A0A3S0JHV4_9BACT|nr:MBL fold metallo-hydrolase [Hymenobacter gummosus]RTQ50299.1 MBL fold metallo-hydrolase [Hymenobacter gummosus]
MAAFTFIFVEMGQGDCTLVQCPDGRVVVVDCGSTNAKEANDKYWIQAYLQLRTWTRTRSNKIDALILTHPDADHHNQVVTFFQALTWSGNVTLPDGTVLTKPAGGKVDIDTIYVSNAVSDTSPLGHYTGAALNTNVYSHYFNTSTVYEVTSNTTKSKGNVLKRWTKASNFGTLAGTQSITGNKVNVLSGGTGAQSWSIDILAGNVPGGYGKVKDLATEDNARSLITLFTMGTRKVLLCGDATLSTEKFLLDAHAATISDVDLIMVPHHGSAYASGWDFVKKTNPSAGVVSVGFLEHSFRLPRYSILERWLETIEKKGATIADHDIDYWELIDFDEVDEQYNKWVASSQKVAWNDSKTFCYLLNPGNKAFALYKLQKAGMWLYRETVNSPLTMTSQKTQVYQLSSAGVSLQ